MRHLCRFFKFTIDFGVDITKPDECMSVELDNTIQYIGIDYTVCGKVVTMGQYEIDIQDENVEDAPSVQLPMNFLTFGEIENDDVKIYIPSGSTGLIEIHDKKITACRIIGRWDLEEMK